MAADRQWAHSLAPKTNSCVQPALLWWTEGSRSGRARFPWSGLGWWREKSVAPRGSFQSCRRGQNKATKAKIALRERCTSTWRFSVSGVFIFPLTPGLEESVVNGLLHRGQLPCWNSSSCGTEESAVGQACVSENKQSSARSLLPSIHQHSLMSGSVEGVSSAPGPVPVSSITFKIVMPPSHPGSLLPCKLRNGLGQALCQPVGGGGRSKAIVMWYHVEGCRNKIICHRGIQTF